ADAGLVPGSVYELSPGGIAFGAPVELSIAYAPAALPAGAEEAGLAVHGLVGGAWVELSGGGADPEGGRVRAPLEHFSVYGILTRRPVASLEVAPDSATLSAVGGTVPFRALLRDAGGNELDPSRRTVDWSTSDPRVATVDARGTATALRNGTAVVTARVG